MQYNRDKNDKENSRIADNVSFASNELYSFLLRVLPVLKSTMARGVFVVFCLALKCDTDPDHMLGDLSLANVNFLCYSTTNRVDH